MAAYLATTRKDRNTGFSKHGSKANGTDGAHKCSHHPAGHGRSVVGVDALKRDEERVGLSLAVRDAQAR